MTDLGRFGLGIGIALVGIGVFSIVLFTVRRNWLKVLGCCIGGMVPPLTGG
jgi:hypothetical protein